MIIADKCQALFQLSHKIYYSEFVQAPISIVNFCLGISAAYKIAKTCCGIKRDYKVPHLLKKWNVTTLKTIDFLGEISLVLGGLTCRPTIFAGRWVFQQLSVSTDFFNARLRKIIVIASVIIGMPSMIKNTYLFLNAKKEKKLRVESIRTKIATIRAISLTGSALLLKG